jgi:hypothetical protein
MKTVQGNWQSPQSPYWLKKKQNSCIITVEAATNYQDRKSEQLEFMKY